jgi:hypothetical protein
MKNKKLYRNFLSQRKKEKPTFKHIRIKIIKHKIKKNKSKSKKNKWRNEVGEKFVSTRFKGLGWQESRG